jgi:hypothetical protein
MALNYSSVGQQIGADCKIQQHDQEHTLTNGHIRSA